MSEVEKFTAGRYNSRDAQQEAFNELQTALHTEPILQYPDFTKTFNLTTDASGHVISGVLSQGEVGNQMRTCRAH